MLDSGDVGVSDRLLWTRSIHRVLCSAPRRVASIEGIAFMENKLRRPHVWLAVAWAVVTVAGCAGLLGGGGLRQTNTEMVIVHFGSLQGEIKECG